jgi:hypothetical protein
MIYTRSINAQKLLLECSAEFQPAAEDVFNLLAGISAAGTPLRDGSRVRFGWSMLALRSEGAALRVCEPDFSGDPFTALHPTLDRTFAITATQLQWLRRAGAQGQDVHFEQHVVFTHLAFDAPDIFALRNAPESDMDSGWSVAPVAEAGGDIDTSQLSTVPVYRLADSSPQLVSVLALPVGHLVTLHDGRVVEITDPDGFVVWQSDDMNGLEN